MASIRNRVSVIIPIFNAMPYLTQALESVCSQDYDDLEIICINDGSTDDSLEVIHRFANIDNRIVVIDKQNEGYGASCNKGLDASSGEWIAILEPDDWIEQGMFSHMVAFANSFSEQIDIVKSPYWRINAPEASPDEKLECSYMRAPLPKKQPFKLKDMPGLIADHPSIWTALYRKEFLEDSNIRFCEFPGAGWADNPFLIETMCQANSIAFWSQPYYCYREEPLDKADAFSRNCYKLIFDRWSRMTDIIDRLGIKNEGILRAHYRRGFAYAERVVDQMGLDNSEVFRLAYEMFSRMNPSIVKRDLTLTEERKALFGKVLGIEKFELGRMEKIFVQIKRTTETAATVGLKETFGTIRSYLG